VEASGTTGTKTEKCEVAAEAWVASTNFVERTVKMLPPAGAVASTTSAAEAPAGSLAGWYGSVTVTGTAKVCPSGPRTNGVPTTTPVVAVPPPSATRPVEGIAFGCACADRMVVDDSAPAGTRMVTPSGVVSIPPLAGIDRVVAAPFPPEPPPLEQLVDKMQMAAMTRAAYSRVIVPERTGAESIPVSFPQGNRSRGGHCG
jgi:hypothetical protein